jgi:hypothetical protein
MTVRIDRIIAKDFHRNGVCGMGFYVVDFVFSDEELSDIAARAIIFPDDEKTPTYYAITTEDICDKWRGDHFIDDLWNLIQIKEPTP